MPPCPKEEREVFSMLTSKQRSHLKSLAANLQPVGQFGKGGMSENMLRSFSDALEARELIKINVLTNAEEMRAASATSLPPAFRRSASPSSAGRSSCTAALRAKSSSIFSYKVSVYICEN